MAIKVPNFLLKRIYVQGSLRNTDEGFEFKLKNSLGSGYAYGLMPIIMDGEVLPAAQSNFSVDGRRIPFPLVTKENPATLAMNREAVISIAGKTLEPGAHKFTMGFHVTGLGELGVELVDTVPPGP